jgi:hypothetical protein
MPFKSDSSDVALSIWSDATRTTLEKMQLGCAVVMPDLTGATYPGASASKPSVRALPPPPSSFLLCPVSETGFRNGVAIFYSV